ncbi:MAG: peptide deformylase [Pseudomonadota bacterium]|nr:peptide deformylase [Pseudomonadota bacterium]
MSTLKVARMGHPILREKAKELTLSEIKSERVQRLIDDMIETMHEYDGVGLAAPQVHESLRISVIEFDLDNERYKDSGVQSLIVCINPKVKVLDKKTHGYWEGCLSVPGIRGYVKRPQKIEVHFLNRMGQKQTITAEGFLATVFQHEFDHLDGELFVDKVASPEQLAFTEEYLRYHHNPEAEEELD